MVFSPNCRGRSPASALALAALGFAAIGLGAARARAAVDTTVQMRDGTPLATTIYAPGDDLQTPRPVVFNRTPYGRAWDPDEVAAYNAAGYVVVSQDFRGLHGSAGTYRPFFDDANDAEDSIAWIAAQSFSNGRVGMEGISAEGITQHMARKNAPAALSCTHIGVAGSDMWENVFDGGVFRPEIAVRWLANRGAPTWARTLHENEVRGPFWDQIRLSNAELASVTTPTLLVAGMYDMWAQGMVRDFLRYKAHGGAPASTWLVLGPWTHEGAGQTRQGALTFPADAAYTTAVADLKALFDHCLLDAAAPTWAPVRYYQARIASDGTSGAWQTADTWPPAGSRTVELFLHEDGVLRQATNAADDGPTAVPVDPENPVVLRGGGNLFEPAGPFAQDALLVHPHAVVQRTPPMAEDTAVVGTLAARVYAASATTDVDVITTALLEHPDGSTTVLAHGARRGRFVQGTDAVRPLVPEEPALFDVTLGPVAYTVPQGTRLAIVLTGTGTPRYDVNPNVATPVAQDPLPTATTLRVFHDAAHPSAILVPVLGGTLPADPAQEDRGGAEPDPPAGGCAAGGGRGALGSLWAALGFAGLLGRARRALVFRE